MHHRGPGRPRLHGVGARVRDVHEWLAARLDRANGGEIVPGVVFAFAGKSINGFPFRLDTVLDGVTFSHQGPEGQTAWRAEKLALHALTYGRPLYIFEAAGLQSFEQPGEPGTVPHVTFLTPAIARASVILSQGKLARLDVDLWQPNGKDATQGTDPARTFSAARAQLHLLNTSGNTIDVAARIEAAHLGTGYRPALGGDIALIELRGKLLQRDALDGLSGGVQSVFDATERWRQAAGKLAVDRLALNWAPVKTELQGELGLDGLHRPQGVLTGSIDAGALVSTLSGGTLNLSSAGGAKATFSLQFKDGDVTIDDAIRGRKVLHVSLDKTVDGFLRYKVLRQTTGAVNFPVKRSRSRRLRQMP
jgi:hypothetical protein